MERNKFRYVILLFAIVIIFMMVGKANAVPYSQVSIFDNITQTSYLYSYSTVHYTITIYNASDSKFNISLPSNTENLTVLNGVTFNIYPSSDCHTVSVPSGCILVGLNNIKSGVPINLQYNYYQNYTGLNNSFNSTIYFLPSSSTRSLSIDMLLPKGAYIPSGAYNIPTSTITPVASRFEVSWNLINQTYLNVTGYYINLPFIIQYNDVIPTSKAPPNNNYYLYYIIIPIILIAAFVLYFYFVKNRHADPRKPVKNDNKKLLFSLLNHDEKIILSTLNKKDFIYQADIIKKTGFSKIKVSKILSKLSRYRLLKIKQDGRTNKVKRL